MAPQGCAGDAGAGDGAMAQAGRSRVQSRSLARIIFHIKKAGCIIFEMDQDAVN